MCVTIQQITEFLESENVDFWIVNRERFNELKSEIILRPNSISASQIGELTFLNKKQENFTSQVIDATVIFNEIETPLNLSQGIEIRLSNARFWFSRVSNYFFPVASHPLTCFKDVIQNEEIGLILGLDCQVHPDVFIGQDVILGNDVKVGPGSVIHSGVKVGDGTVLGSGSVVGGTGFGIERLGNRVERIPHYGSVQIGEKVVIGSNTCVDRGVFSDTFIDNQVQIDNLVHIAHGVTIGDSTFVVAGSLICGSVTIGKRVWIGGNSSIREGINIGDDSFIGLGTVVLQNVQAGETIIGNPGRPLAR